MMEALFIGIHLLRGTRGGSDAHHLFAGGQQAFRKNCPVFFSFFRYTKDDSRRNL